MPGFFDVCLRLESEFEVAGAEVADVGDIAGEAFFGDGGGGEFEKFEVGHGLSKAIA